MERESLKSRLGFIMLSAGCAIGIGNVWKFPYVAAQSGGGAFVLIYLLFLVVIGLPILTMEFSVGRASRRSIVKSFKVLEKPGTKWHLHGYVGFAGNYLLMMFYTTVAGWMLYYFYKTMTGGLNGAMPEEISAGFDALMDSPAVMGFWTILVVVIGCLVCAIGLQKGIERVTKIMMVALLGIMVIMAVHSILMPGASEGLEFYLLPDLERMKQVGIGETVVSALTQAFFTISIGMGSMAIFGSYIGKERSLVGESGRIIALDTFVAITAGLIIIPACFSYGVDLDAGPSLIFKTLPNIFANMPFGQIWGSFFFLFLAFAALSTVFAVFENIICMGMEVTGCSRKKSSFVNMVLIAALSMPCVLGFNVLKGGWLNIFGGTVLDLEDFIVSNLILPIGALIYLLFCVSKKGWGWDNYFEEVNTGKGAKIKKWMRVYLTYILPFVLIFIIVMGIYGKFFAG